MSPFPAQVHVWNSWPPVGSRNLGGGVKLEEVVPTGKLLKLYLVSSPLPILPVLSAQRHVAIVTCSVLPYCGLRVTCQGCWDEASENRSQINPRSLVVYTRTFCDNNENLTSPVHNAKDDLPCQLASYFKIILNC